MVRETSTSYEVFDEYWCTYDEWYVKNYSVWVSECLCLKLLGTAGLVLDVGVGTGIFRKCMLGYVVGVDPALKPMALATERGVAPVSAFGEHLPFRSGVFDWAVLVVTICFLSDPIKVLQEVNRVLRFGGYIAICFVPKESEWGKYYIMKAWRGESLFYKYARFYSVREILDLLFSAGFSFREFTSTLCRDPRTPPTIELPKRNSSSCGFVCVKAVKP